MNRRSKTLLSAVVVSGIAAAAVAAATTARPPLAKVKATHPARPTSAPSAVAPPGPASSGYWTPDRMVHARPDRHSGVSWPGP